MTPDLSLVMTPEESRRLHTFLQEQARARDKIALLEDEAGTLAAAGKVVPANDKLKTARILKYLFALE